MPIPLPIHEPVKNKNGKLNRKRRFDPYTQEKAAQYAYAHIPIPENHSAYPLLPTLHAFHSSGASNDGARLLLDEYSALEEEFKNSLLKSHKLCSQKEEFHWKEYVRFFYNILTYIYNFFSFLIIWLEIMLIFWIFTSASTVSLFKRSSLLRQIVMYK